MGLFNEEARCFVRPAEHKQRTVRRSAAPAAGPVVGYSIGASATPAAAYAGAGGAGVALADVPESASRAYAGFWLNLSPT